MSSAQHVCDSYFISVIIENLVSTAWHVDKRRTPTMLISLRQSLGELMETGKYSPCTTSSFLLLLQGRTTRDDRLEGLTCLDWGMCMWAHLPSPEFVQLGPGSSQCSQDVTLEGFCAQVEDLLCMAPPENCGAKSCPASLRLVRSLLGLQHSPSKVQIDPVSLGMVTVMIEYLMSEQGAL